MANSLTIASGGMQGAFVSTAFTLPVTVLVKDASNVPQVGVTVSSSVPGAGASCTTAASAVTNGSGIASFTLTANSTAGQYAVSFGSSGAISVASLFRNSSPVSTSQLKTPATRTQQVAGSIYTISWTNPGFLSSTGTTNYATVTTTSVAGSQLIMGSDFGFTLPTDAIVTGYVADFYAGFSGTDGDQSTALVISPSTDSGVLFARQKNPTLSAWRHHYTEGGSSDLWGAAALTGTQVDSSSFLCGFLVGATSTPTSITRINEMTVRVYYNTAPALPVLDTAAPLTFCAN